MRVVMYGKGEWEGLWSIKWLKWTMVDKLNEMDYGTWNEWDGLWYTKINEIQVNRQICTTCHFAECNPLLKLFSFSKCLL